MTHASLRGIRVAYERAGESGTPVVLIMGYGMPGSAWRHQVPVLAKHHRVLTFDNRGAGDTASPAGVHSMRLYAEDTLALLDHVGFERVHVVGVSMGGMIAQELALRFRPRVASLSLVATHPGGLGAVLPPRRGLSLFVTAQRAGVTERVAALEQLLFPQAFLDTCDRAWLRDVLRQDFGRPTPAKQRFSQLSAVLRHRTASRLHALAGLPTLLVQPVQDVLVDPRHSERLQALIPGSRLVRYEDAGHGLIRQCAARLNEDLLAHFRATEAAAAA